MKIYFCGALSFLSYSVYAGDFSLKDFLTEESPYTLETLENHIKETQNKSVSCDIAIVRSQGEAEQPYWCEAEELAWHVLKLDNIILQHPHTQKDVSSITPYTLTFQNGAKGSYSVDTGKDINGINLVSYAIKHAPQKVFEDYFIDCSAMITTYEKYFFITSHLKSLMKNCNLDIARRALLLNALIKAQVTTINKKIRTFEKYFEWKLVDEAYGHCNVLLEQEKEKPCEDAIGKAFYYLTAATQVCTNRSLSCEVFFTKLGAVQDAYGNVASQAINREINRLLRKTNE